MCFADAEAVFTLLKNCHPNLTAYLKSDIPDRLHYRNNDRVQPIILIADEGWTIVQGEKKLPRCTSLICYTVIPRRLLSY